MGLYYYNDFQPFFRKFSTKILLDRWIGLDVKVTFAARTEAVGPPEGLQKSDILSVPNRRHLCAQCRLEPIIF
jgi:hypothetical protein